jgi:hypothetical protein
VGEEAEDFFWGGGWHLAEIRQLATGRLVSGSGFWGWQLGLAGPSLVRGNELPRRARQLVETATKKAVLGEERWLIGDAEYDFTLAE